MSKRIAASGPGIFDDLIPKEHWLIPAWLGCLRYTISDDEMMAAFRKETGNWWEPAANPLSRMIDESSGADIDFFRALAKWMNENVWGDPDGEDDGDGHP